MKINLKLLTIVGAILLVTTGCDDKISNSTSVSTPDSNTSISSSLPGATKYDMKTGESKEITGANVQVISGEDNIIVSQGALSATIYAVRPGKVELNNGSEKFELEISLDVFGLGNGDSYSTRSGANYRGEKENPFVVGTKNAVKLDIDVTYSTWVYNGEKLEVDLVNDNLFDIIECFDYEVDYSFKFEETDLAINDLVTINEDYTITFKDAAVGKNVEVTLLTEFDNSEIKQTFLVNDGYNAYDNASFKELFQNREIAKINVLRNFEAELDESQYYFNTRFNKLLPYNTVDAEAEIKYQGSLYFRYGGLNNGTLTPLEVNGNYMQIDGSKLPDHIAFDKSNEGSYPDMPEGFASTQAGAIGTTAGTTNPVVNPHAAIFRVCNFGSTEEETMKLNIKNLSVIGASVLDENENPTMHSGGFVGAFVDGTVAEFANCNFQYLVYGMQVNFFNSQLKVKDTQISDTWGPSITTWQAKDLKIENTLLTKAGGPTIWAINCYGREAGKNGSVTINIDVDSKSDLTNYMLTNSSWFKAYNLDISMQAQTINAVMNNINYSIFKSGTTQMNFVGLFQKGSDFSQYPVGAMLKIGNQTTHINPIQFTDSSSKFTPFNPYGNAIFQSSKSIILGFGQEIDASNPQVAYMTQLATVLETYRATGEQHLYIEIDVEMAGELLAAVLEVVPLQK